MQTLSQDQNIRYYQDFYQFIGRSPRMEKIWSEAFGNQYPEGLDHYGYLTKFDINFAKEKLSVNESDVILDLGCGKGGPGMRIAEDLALKLIGVDIIPEAIHQARSLAKHFKLRYVPNFKVGEFYHIPLENQSMDGVLSFDALWTAKDQIKALMEVKRVMKPYAKFIFTHWDTVHVDPVASFEKSELAFISRFETPSWKEYQFKVYEGIIRHQKDLVGEMGEAAKMLIYEATSSINYLDLSVRRIYEMQFQPA